MDLSILVEYSVETVSHVLMTVMIASSGNTMTNATAITPTQAYQSASSSSTIGGECLILRNHQMQKDTGKILNYSNVTFVNWVGVSFFTNE